VFFVPELVLLWRLSRSQSASAQPWGTA